MKKIFLFVLLALTACKKEVKEEPHIFRTYEASMKRKSDSLPPLPLGLQKAIMPTIILLLTPLIIYITLSTISLMYGYVMLLV